MLYCWYVCLSEAVLVTITVRLSVAVNNQGCSSSSSKSLVSAFKVQCCKCIGLCNPCLSLCSSTCTKGSSSSSKKMTGLSYWLLYMHACTFFCMHAMSLHLTSMHSQAPGYCSLSGLHSSTLASASKRTKTSCQAPESQWYAVDA